MLPAARPLTMVPGWMVNSAGASTWMKPSIRYTFVLNHVVLLVMSLTMVTVLVGSLAEDEVVTAARAASNVAVRRIGAFIWFNLDALFETFSMRKKSTAVV